MTANELVGLDVDGWTGLQPGTAYEAMGRKERLHTVFKSWNLSRIMLVSARLYFLASQYLSSVVMFSDEHVGLDTGGFVEEQPNIVLEEFQQAYSEHEPSPTGPTYDLSAEVEGQLSVPSLGADPCC